MNTILAFMAVAAIFIIILYFWFVANLNERVAREAVESYSNLVIELEHVAKEVRQVNEREELLTTHIDKRDELIEELKTLCRDQNNTIKDLNIKLAVLQKAHPKNEKPSCH